MAYIGNKGSLAGFVNQPSKQDLTGATGGTLTLTHAVSGPEDISLFINNVRQEPTESYTVTGTTVTLQGYTVAATDDIYVLYNGLTQLSSVPVDGSVSDAKISAMSASKLTGALPAIDGSALTGLGGSVAFLATITTTYTVNAAGVSTAVDYNTNGTEQFDIGNCFDKTNNKFIAPVAGIYQFNISLRVDSIASNDYINMGLQTPSYSGNGQGTSVSDIVYRSAYVLIGQPSTDYQSLTASTILQCTANQEIEHWVRTESDTAIDINDRGGMFSGVLIG